MKLAPPKNTLQPLPPDVQPAVSQSVQRAATPVDAQAIQNVQIVQASAGQPPQSSTVEPLQALAPMVSANSAVLWFVLVIAIIVAAGLVWFWRSF